MEIASVTHLLRLGKLVVAADRKRDAVIRNWLCNKTGEWPFQQLDKHTLPSVIHIETPSAGLQQTLEKEVIGIQSTRRAPPS